MAEKHTCCPACGAGIHRQSITAPDRPEVAASAEVRAAERELSKAVTAELQAHEVWSTAETARRDYEAALNAKYRSSIAVFGGAGFADPGGRRLATSEERAQLERLTKDSESAFERYQFAGAVVVEKRQAHAVAQHRETQQVVASWAEGA